MNDALIDTYTVEWCCQNTTTRNIKCDLGTLDTNIHFIMVVVYHSDPPRVKVKLIDIIDSAAATVIITICLAVMELQWLQLQLEQVV